MPLPTQELMNHAQWVGMINPSIVPAEQALFMDQLNLSFDRKKELSGSELRFVIIKFYKSKYKDLILTCIDLWLHNLKNHLDAADLSALQILLYDAIQHQKNDLAFQLVDAGLGREQNGPQQFGAQYNALLFSILHDNKEVFKRLLPIYNTTMRLDDVNQFGETAIYLALSLNREDMVDDLLQVRYLQIRGRMDSKALFDLVRLQPDGWKKLATALQGRSKFDYDWSYDLDMPIALLKSSQQDLLLLILQEELKTNKKISPEIQDRILKFLDDPRPLPFKRMNRLSIAFECVSYLLHPEWINQHVTNLCGPAVVMQQLVIVDPEKFVNMVCELAELTIHPQTQFLPTLVKHVTPDVINTCWNLSSFWLETMRHNYNALVGFSYDSKYADYTALTTPHLLAKMFEDVGLTILEENTQIRFSKYYRLTSLFESARPWVAKVGFLFNPYKIYGKAHFEQSDPEDRFQSFMRWLSGNSVTPILINKHLLDRILDKQATADTQKLIEFSHYVNIFDFKYDTQAQTVSFKCMTFGRTYDVLNLDKKFFADNFLGGLLIKPVIAPRSRPTM